MSGGGGRLAGKVAIVTGAAGGMGEASARLFAAEGAKVAAIDLDEARVAPVVEAIRVAGGSAIAVGCDVTRSDQIAAMLARVVAELGAPTVLFNNAGVDTEGRKPILDADEAAFDRCIEVNLKSVWLMTKLVAPAMIAAGGGSIVNTASIGAFIAVSSAGYSAAKAGVLALTRATAVELGDRGIRCNALCPGATETPMAREQRLEMKARGLPTTDDLIQQMGVLGRMAEPIEMARMALFLASDESSFATGASFNNDAGWTAMSGISRATVAG